MPGLRLESRGTTVRDGKTIRVEWFRDPYGHRFWREEGDPSSPRHLTPTRLCDGCRKAAGLPCGCDGRGRGV